MPPKSKKTAKKAAKAASSKASTAVMSNWLAAGKKTADTNAMDESKEDVEDPIEDANEEAPPPVKRPKRGGARTSATKAVEQPPPESDSQMEGIEPLEDEYEAVDMNSQIDALQAKAAEPLEEGRTLRGGRNTLFRSISALDEGTTALLHQYEGDALEDADDLLSEVLGTRPPSKVAAKEKGKKRTSSKIASLNITTSAASRKPGADPLDGLLAQNEREEYYSQKLAQTLGDISSGAGSASNTENRPRPQVQRLENIETDEFSHETTYLVIYFAPSAPMPALPSFTPAVPFEVADPSLALQLPALAANTAENQDLFNRICSTPGAVLKLPLLKALLRKRPCPSHVADWLLRIVVTSKVPQIAFEAYDILLSLMRPPGNAWHSRVAKNNSVAPFAADHASPYGLPLIWDYQRIAEVFNTFGAGQLASVVSGTGEKALLKDTIAALPRLSTGQFDVQNLMGQLEVQANSMTDEVQAATLARAAHDLQNSLICANFNASGFSLIVLHLTAAFKSGYFKLDRQELITLVVGVYRAMVDPSCQSIIADLQALLLALYELLFAASDDADVPKLVHDICESLWTQIPEAQHDDFHATYFRWTYLTPCSTVPLQHVRAAMAFVFLKALAKNPLFPLVVPSDKVPSYKLGDPLVTFPEVIEFLQKTKLVKDQSTNWPRYANWILLIDIATACIDAAKLPTLKRAITQWETAFGNFHAPARERGTFNLNLARLKDLATHSLTKMRVINHSYSVVSKDAFESFRNSTTTTAEAESS